MRFSTSAVVAAVAIGAQAAPQSVAPIVQISDGQIQAPGTSYAVPSAPAATAVLPSVTAVPLPSVVPSSAVVVPVPSSVAPIVPSAPAGSAAHSVPYPVSSGAVYTNGTVLPTGAPTTTSPAGTKSTGSLQPTSAPGSGAATTFVSMGALFAGLFAFLA